MINQTHLLNLLSIDFWMNRIWFSGSVGLWINHSAYNSFAFNLKRCFGKRPFSAFYTLTNQENNAERISEALRFLPPPEHVFSLQDVMQVSQVGYVFKCTCCYFDSSLKIWMVISDIFHVSVELPHCFRIETHLGFTATCLFCL